MMLGTRRYANTGTWVRHGAIGGLVGGLVMAMVAMLYTLFAQDDLLAPLKQMGATFFRYESGSLGSMITGLMLHMMMSVVFGIVFALIVKGRATGFGSLIGAGMIFIAVEWAISRFIVLPVVDQPLVATFGATGGIVAHAMYGAVLGLWLASKVSADDVSPVVARQDQA
ncbi:MAG: hypothetical protein NVS1B1_00260 [Candidatus Limnocylindrales bacterium]